MYSLKMSRGVEEGCCGRVVTEKGGEGVKGIWPDIVHLYDFRYIYP